MTYEDLRQAMKETMLKATTITDVWLKESTVNAILHEAKETAIAQNRLILTFDDGTQLSIVSSGQIIGSEDISYWHIYSFLDYHYKLYYSEDEKRAAVLL